MRLRFCYYTWLINGEHFFLMARFLCFYRWMEALRNAAENNDEGVSICPPAWSNKDES